MVAPYEHTIHEYLRQLSSEAPIPGGGSTSAVVASLGAAMALMAANITIRSTASPAIQSLVRAFQKITERFERLCAEDMRSFQQVMAALEEKAEEGLLQSTIRQAAKVPLEISKICHQALELCEQLEPLIKKNVASDLGCAVFFLQAARQGSLLTMEINLRYLKDPLLVQTFQKEKERIDLACEGLAEKMKGRIEDKLKEIRGTSRV